MSRVEDQMRKLMEVSRNVKVNIDLFLAVVRGCDIKNKSRLRSIFFKKEKKTSKFQKLLAYSEPSVLPC